MVTGLAQKVGPERICQVPQIGNVCPGRPTETHTFESNFCLEKCTAQCVPPSVLVHIREKNRTDKHAGHYISVTALLTCMRQLYLERILDYFVSPPLNWYSIRGTLIHNILEQPTIAGDVNTLSHKLAQLFKRDEMKNAEANKEKWAAAKKILGEIAKDAPGETIPDWRSEVEYEYPLGVYSCESAHIWNAPVKGLCPECGSEKVTPWFLKGTVDVIRPEAGEVWDYKTIGDRGLSVVKRGAKKEHVMQFNMYRFMVERGCPVGVKKEDYTPIQINRIRAYYATMMQVIGTGNLLTEDTIYRVSEPFTESTEVSREIIDEREDLVLKKGKRKATAGPDDYVISKKTKYRMTYAVPEVEMMPLEDVEAFIKGAAPVLISAFVRGDMPSMCNPEMRAWRCERFCPKEIREACDKHNDSVGVNRKDGVEEIKEDEVIPVEV